jgi:general stress protein 26
MTNRGFVATCATILCAAVVACGAPAADGSGRLVQAPARAEILAAAGSVIAGARYATFITLDEAGHPQARIVDPFAPEDGLVVWIATNARSRKVAQVEANPRATLLYFDAARDSYVTLIGTAELVHDPDEKAKRWKEEWAAFYEDRHRGDDYLLIKVTPTRLEIVSEALGMRNNPETWRPVTLDLGPR